MDRHCIPEEICPSRLTQHSQDQLSACLHQTWKQLEHRTTMSTIQNLSETSLVIQLDKQHIISDKHHLHCLNKTSICLATS